MKKLFYLLITLMSLTTFVGCEKNDARNNLIGVWELYCVDYYIDNECIESENVTEKVLFTITAKTISDGHFTSEYVLEDNKIIIGTGENLDVMEIMENKSNKLTLKTSPIDGSYQIFYFKKS